MSTQPTAPATEPRVDADQTVAKSRAVRPVTLRAVLIGAVLIPINILWVITVEHVKYEDNVSTSALYFNCVFLLLVLLLINWLWRRILPGRQLSRGEMLTVYVMVVISTGLCGHDQMQILFTTIHYAVQRATPESGWQKTILPYLPAHLVPPAGDAVRDLYRGNSTLYMPSHYLPWLKPLAWWSACVMAVVWVMLCMASIFRKQWDSERLTYPIAEIPLQITDPKAEILGSKLFWGAFCAAAGIRALVMAHYLVPSIPLLPVNMAYYPLSTSPPWVYAGQIPVSFFPFAIGLSFFLPAQISFSVWFFYWLARLELVTAAAFGQTQWGGFPYVSEQSGGAAIGLAIAVLYYARAHLRSVWRCAWGRLKMDDENEPLPYRTAFWGLVFGCLFLVWFAIHAGMRPITAIIYLSLTLLFVLVTARIRAEVGLPTLEIYGTGADNILRIAGGHRAWTRHELTAMSLLYWLTRTHRQFPMNTHVDAMRIGNRSGIGQRSLTYVIVLASGISVIAAFWGMLHIMYQVGYESAKFNPVILPAFGADPWNRQHSYTLSPLPPDFSKAGGYAFGTIFAIFLAAMRTRLPWWPFHPAGYLASGSFGLPRMWIPIFIAWVCKTSLLRYGGLTAYRKAIPFFLGLIAGEFTMGMLGSLAGLCGFYLPPSAGIGGL